jgi:hypothetical protein
MRVGFWFHIAGALGLKTLAGGTDVSALHPTILVEAHASFAVSQRHLEGHIADRLRLLGIQGLKQELCSMTRLARTDRQPLQ